MEVSHGKAGSSLRKQYSSKQFLKGAMVLTVAALVTKILSAVYRVPFQNIVGDIGFYIYQQVYPFYGIAIALSTYGFPVIISKLVAEKLEENDEEGAKDAALTSFLFLCITGLIWFMAVFFGAGMIAGWMGDPHLKPLIQVISLSFLLLPPLSALRGYYQGKEDMLPTAVSQVAEQSFRVVTILVFRPFRLPRLRMFQENPGATKGIGQILEASRGLRALPYFGAIIIFTLTFKAGDALMASMVSPFWKDMGFSGTQYGLVSGMLGSFATILGGLLGGWLTTRWGIGTGLWTMGALQAFSNLGYWAAALPGMGRYVLFQLTIPFLGKTVPIYPIYLASQGESITSGMGTAAFMAFLMSLCDKRFSAMHYAFFAMLFTFSARIFGYFGGLGAGSFGYAKFFFLSFLAAWPAFALLPWILPVVRRIEGR